MPQAIIENPILNSPHRQPDRHFQFSEDGITDHIVDGRRVSMRFVPVPRPKKRGQQLAFETEWTDDRIEENEWVNKVRARVTRWRNAGYVPLPTPTTHRLLEYWTDPDRENRLYFCQIEALETAIYLTEIAAREGDAWIDNDLRRFNAEANPGLFRTAFKMATGTGKTVVMAMVIAWQTLNKVANPQDARFGDSFLIVTPGITIRDRLRVLKPQADDNYYLERQLIPDGMWDDLLKARIIITNFHAFNPKETISAAKRTKELLKGGDGDGVFKETMDQVVRRVCREFDNKRDIIVLNDEAHHCYRRKQGGDEEKLVGDERKEAEKAREEARVWISGLEAVARKIGVRVVYDLSATPFFLKGSGYNEGDLFKWVVSDFSLIDAIEAGIVKVPRVPVADDANAGRLPVYRHIWPRIRDWAPPKGRGKAKSLSEGEPQLHPMLEAALRQLYDNYQKRHEQWLEAGGGANGHSPPVFIVVCNNTNVSNIVYRYIAGWDKTLPDGTTLPIAGKLPLFSNVEGDRWLARPNSILIDSEELESGEGLSAEFKQVAAREVEEFRHQVRAREPDRDVTQISDDDLLREVMNTVGKPGKLGERIKCVVSVSMLTEGWDANTVTHILGVRAFGTQLLCEQVVGRGLRRTSFAMTEEGHFYPEYAEVYGVPFSFIPTAGSTTIVVGKQPTHVRAMEDRKHLAIQFPRLIGYRYDIQDQALAWEFTDKSTQTLATQDIPTKVENAPIVGEIELLTLDAMKARREQEVAFLVAKLVLEKYFRQEGDQRPDKTDTHHFDAEVQAWLFPQVLKVTRLWMKQCLVLKDNTFPQLLLLLGLAHDASERIYRAIAKGSQSTAEGAGRALLLKPILQPYNTIGNTNHVSFQTLRPTWKTRPDKCHVSHVVADTQDWEQMLAAKFEEDDMTQVVSYVKNDHMGFAIPYTIRGQPKNYLPDFIVRYDDGHGPDDLLNLIVELSGQPKKDKQAKVDTAKSLWVPAVNNHGGFGRWAFLEITDIDTAKGELRKQIHSIG